jgi:hypothetical protein
MHIAEPVGESSPPPISTGPALHIRGWHSPTPIGPGAPEEGSSYRRVLCAAATRVVGRGLRGSGRGKAKGWSLPAKLQPFTPLFERSCVYFIAA